MDSLGKMKTINVAVCSGVL